MHSKKLDEYHRALLNQTDTIDALTHSLLESCRCADGDSIPLPKPEPSLSYVLNEMRNNMRSIELHLMTIASAQNIVSTPNAAIRELVKALDARQCPEGGCKCCKHYVAGSVDGCNLNEAIAEYLIGEGYVIVRQPEK